MEKERIITYIDGFNLYFGLKSKGWKRYYWINLQKLSENLLKANQFLEKTKYFTAIISLPPDKMKRQNLYIDALLTLNNLDVFFGKYQSNFMECHRCKSIIEIPNEKMTDVNIATEILYDAFQDNFDTAILISADSDLSSPLRKILELFPKKKIVCAFPPNRFSKELMKRASAHFVIGRKKLADSLFPNEVIKKDGYILRKPDSWK